MVFTFVVPRGGGCKRFWGLFDIYGALGFNFRKGIRCKWLYDNASNWTKLFGKFFKYGTHLVFSNHPTA